MIVPNIRTFSRTFLSYQIVNNIIYRYDYPDPGSEIDYIADNRVDYVRHHDGVAVAQFKKKIKNHQPFVSFIIFQNIIEYNFKSMKSHLDYFDF